MGGKIDYEINKQGGPYVFRINGQTYHLLGSLCPDNGEKPKFAQLYIHDTENEISNRLGFIQGDNQNNLLQEKLVTNILHMLDNHNVLVKSFRMVRDKYDHHDVGELKLRLLSNRLTDGRQNNLPCCSEVAALLVDESSNEESHRVIIVEHKTIGLQRIKELHPSFMALQYPLLFPYGEDGYRIGISHRNPETGSCYKRKTVTMRQYYSFRLQQRAGEAQTLLRSGRLFQQYMVDAYASIEEVRINWIRKNQKQLRAELYNGLRDAINQGDVMTNSVGRMTILPSSYTGGPRYRVQNYQDAMAICRYAGYPDLFLTFTCNPKWPEIQFFLETVEGQKSDDRPDIISRVFSIKLWELINDIKCQQIFGKVTSVERFMIHGPCGILNEKSPCMVNGKCGKHYPKRFHYKTSIDEDGFPIYM
uniref:Uncharacterized protein LOC105851205 isoform X3 n=1 Tax=Cicer arietinum TaxID=3827 RepID=A0A3Q7XS41_CICAR|nr:uncharacterized protein LOC105851205 isoform X3 [Cicer arietinum]